MNAPATADAHGDGAPAVARVFFLFGLLGVAFVVLGTIMMLHHGDVRASFVPSPPGEFFSELSSGRARGVLSVGLYCLLALPLVRNVAVVLRALSRGALWPAALAILTVILLLLLYLGLSVPA